MKIRKKLIEVALPLDAINEASAREKSIRHGHPSTLHLWWARRPLAAARAVIFAQMVDDPGSWPELFPTEEVQQQERDRLFAIIRELVQWENTTNERVLNQARAEIWKSWRRTCAENQSHPRAKELFNPDRLPAFHDPFAGGGSLPLEAQRLGLEAYASDLNPVAVLINKAMIEIPPKFVNRPPVNPVSHRQAKQMGKVWCGAQGLAEDVRYYGRWMRDEAERRIGHLYPGVVITAEMAKDRPDLKPLVGKTLTVIAWLWARTVKSPNPAFADVAVPLASSFMLCTKEGREVYVEPIVEGNTYHFEVKLGKPNNREQIEKGTSAGKRKAFVCLMSKVPIGYEYIRAEATEGRMGSRMIAMVAESDDGRLYLDPTKEMESVARQAKPEWQPDCEMPKKHRNFQPPVYGMNNLGDLFTSRQAVALSTFSSLVDVVRERVNSDAVSVGMSTDGNALTCGGTGAMAYAESIAVYQAFCVDKATLTNTTQATWQKDPDRLTQAFARQAIPMTWDFAEANPLSEAGGGIGLTSHAVAKVLERLPLASSPGHALQESAASSQSTAGSDLIISTDPPYFDNISYGDLSDYFYVWLRRSVGTVLPDLFETLAVPKAEELIAAPQRHGGREQAERFFLDGMTLAMRRLAERSHPLYPITIYYAFRQSENDQEEGAASTGWETFLAAVVRAGFVICGTWPMRTELTANLKKQISALASSIILVCRPSDSSASTATRREFISSLKLELPLALTRMQRSNIAPVDLAQAAIGPGMAIYTRYSKVVDAEGKPLPVRQALALINQTLDEVLAEQEGDFDGDTRWALAWFEQSAFADGEYGVAETLSKAKNTSIAGLELAGILQSKAGKVRLLRPEELPSDWDPQSDSRLTVWEVVHHLVRRLEKDGEAGAAELVIGLGSLAETARELAYRLYTICERKKRAQEALSYNALVQSWPEIVRLAREGTRGRPQQASMFT